MLKALPTPVLQTPPDSTAARSRRGTFASSPKNATVFDGDIADADANCAIDPPPGDRHCAQP
jgi:hypothetical protein